MTNAIKMLGLLAVIVALAILATNALKMGTNSESESESESQTQKDSPAQTASQPTQITAPSSESSSLNATTPDTSSSATRPTTPADSSASTTDPSQTQSSPPSNPTQPQNPDKVLVRGEGIEITQGELSEAVANLEANLAMTGRNIPSAQRDQIEKNLLDRLVTIELLKSQATEQDKEQADATAEQVVNRYKNQAPSEEVFNQQLASMGTTLEDFHQQIKDRATVEEVIDRNIRSKIEITEEQAREYYEENPSEFTTEERVHARHILLSTRDQQTGQDLPDEEKQNKFEQAQELIQQAKEGADFSELARQHTEDPGSKESGGEYTFPRGQMVKPFEETAFSLEPGEISNVVTTQFGFHIIKLEEKLPAGKQEFSEVEEQVKETLLQEEMETRLPQYLDTLKEEKNVKVVKDESPS